MENMDSTVIATSLPAIAADIGTSPLTLKLAITSYLLSLAVFIPASGWTADRFGARAGVLGCHRRVHDRVGRLRAVVNRSRISSSPASSRARRRDDDAGGRLVLVRSIDKSGWSMRWPGCPSRHLIGP
jgi:hypothetical protein